MSIIYNLINFRKIAGLRVKMKDHQSMVWITFTLSLMSDCLLRQLLIESSSLSNARIFKNMMNNYAWRLIIWWKRKIFIYYIKHYWILNAYLVSMIYFSFSFCSDFNLEAIVVKTDEIRGLNQLLTPCFLLIGKKVFPK